MIQRPQFMNYVVALKQQGFKVRQPGLFRFRVEAGDVIPGRKSGFKGVLRALFQCHQVFASVVTCGEQIFELDQGKFMLPKHGGQIVVFAR